MQVKDLTNISHKKKRKVKMNYKKGCENMLVLLGCNYGWCV